MIAAPEVEGCVCWVESAEGRDAELSGGAAAAGGGGAGGGSAAISPPIELPSESSPGAAGGPIVGLSGGLPSMVVVVVKGLLVELW